MDNNELKQNKSPQRLCSEIQLFDLCVLDSCIYKTGSFCSNEDMVSQFEKIEFEISPPQIYMDEEFCDGDETEENDYEESDDDADSDGGEKGWGDDEYLSSRSNERRFSHKVLDPSHH